MIVLVNGLGGTPLLELYVMFHEITTLLAAAGVRVARSLVGNYVTSLDMAGISLTVCRVDEELLRLWDAPCAPPACGGVPDVDATLARAWVAAVAASVTEHAAELTDLDAAIGDGATASTCAAGSTRRSPPWPRSRPTRPGRC